MFTKPCSLQKSEIIDHMTAAKPTYGCIKHAELMLLTYWYIWFL